MELIDKFTPRAAIFSAMCHLQTDSKSEWLNGYKDGLRAALDLVTATATEDAVLVVHGTWVGTAGGYWDGELVYDMWECSECGYDADGADEKPNWHYCPNCGAKMDGGAEDG